MTESLLKEYVLAELNRYKKEGVQLPSAFEQVKQWIGDDSFIHFSNINKLGIKPTYHHYTPAGLYGYPLDQDGFEDFEKDRFTFASSFRYVHVMTLKSREGIYEIGDDMDDEEYRQKIEKLREINGAFRFASHLNRIESIYRAVQGSGRSSFEKRKAFLYCGINGFIDNGSSFLTADIKAQAMFFRQEQVEQRLVVNNPLLKQAIDDVVAGRQTSVKSSAIENLPQNMIDKIVTDPHTKIGLRSQAMAYASLKALLTFAENSPIPFDRTFPVVQIARRFPEHLSPFFYNSHPEVRRTAIEKGPRELVEQYLEKILEAESDPDNIFVLARKVSPALLPRFVSYLDKYPKSSNEFNDLLDLFIVKMLHQHKPMLAKYS